MNPFLPRTLPSTVFKYGLRGACCISAVRKLTYLPQFPCRFFRPESWAAHNSSPELKPCVSDLRWETMYHIVSTFRVGVYLWRGAKNTGDHYSKLVVYGKGQAQATPPPSSRFSGMRTCAAHFGVGEGLTHVLYMQARGNCS
jgi:hypothetical protein